MKKGLAVFVAVVLLMSAVPTGIFAEGSYEISALRAFGWNYDENVQYSTVISVSWGAYRACYMCFELPEEVIELGQKDNIRVIGELSASMSFNNGRVSGQAPIVTIIEADGDAIAEVNLTQGAETTAALYDTWAEKNVLGTFDTLNSDVSEELDLTEIVKSGKEKIGLYLTCRETEGYYTNAGIVNFTDIVLTIEAAEITPEYLLSQIEIPEVLEGGYELPCEILGEKIEWSGEMVEENVIIAGDKAVETEISAKVRVGEEMGEKIFEVTAAGQEDSILSAYTTDESDVDLGKSLHLSLDGEELNFGMGVLFAEADYSNSSAGETRLFENPWVFRTENGFGVIAEIVNASLEHVALGLWKSENLYEYEFSGTLPFDGYEPYAKYENGVYSVIYTSDGTVYKRESVNLEDFGEAVECEKHAKECRLILSNIEAEELEKKLGEIKNVGVEDIFIYTELGEKTEFENLPMMTALYSDGGTDTIPIKWSEADFEKIDFDKAGIYRVSGEADLYEPDFPMIDARPDPDIYYYNGKYYFVATNENGQNQIGIRSGETIAQLADAGESVLLSGSTLWAPELHEIGGALYLIYAKGTAWNNVQAYMMKLEGSDPTNAGDWGEGVRVMKDGGSYLYEDGITLDMTYFEAGGNSYLIWAQREIDYSGSGNHGSSDLYIASVNPENPYHITSEPVLLCRPEYGWDRNTSPIAEGAFAVVHDGKIFVTYSGSGVDNSYVVGLLCADEDADLLDAASWTRSNYPYFASCHTDDEYGPGHNSFVQNEYGKDILVYHAKPNGGTRSAGVRNVYWAADGTPVLYMTPERYLKSEYRSVTATVVVGAEEVGESELYLEYTANSLEVADAEGIRGNIVLPEEGLYGVKIAWESSDESVITSTGKVTRGESEKKAVLTATLTLGELTAERQFEVTILPKEEDAAYLFAYFTGNSASQERLFYGVSRDGYNFKALNGGESVLTSNLGTGCIRDPFIFEGEDGYYYIVATDMKSSLGWSSNYATVVFKTPDFINIVDEAWIDYREFETTKGCTRAWAPQVIWCEEKNAYMIYLAILTSDDEYATVMYRHYATDLCDVSTYTNPELMLDEPAGTGAGAIDGDIIYDKFHDKYIMYYDGKRIAEAETLSGTWTHAETKYDDGQLPIYTAGGASMAVEGSNIWQIIGEDKWVIAADGTSFNGGCYALVETEDFENYTQLWESHGDYSFDFTPRHGYVIPISESELNALFAAYGEVELVEPEYTLKFVNNTTAGFASAEKAWAIAAVYNENGELESVVTEEVSDYKEIEFAPQEGGLVKIMLWGEGEKPLCKAKTKKYD